MTNILLIQKVNFKELINLLCRSLTFFYLLSLFSCSIGHPFLGDYVRLRQNPQWKKICVASNDQYVVFADIINKITRTGGKVKDNQAHSGPENLKKSRPNKFVKWNKSISWNFVLTKFHFLPFQNWPKINFWTGKKFKTAKNAISRKKIDLFDFMSFFAWIF